MGIKEILELLSHDELIALIVEHFACCEEPAALSLLEGAKAKAILRVRERRAAIIKEQERLLANSDEYALFDMELKGLMNLENKLMDVLE